MLLAALDLCALALAGIASLVTRSRLAAVATCIFAAAWLPLNNGHLEGPVLISVDTQHGLTAMDLLSYAGLAVAIWTLVRRTHGRARYRAVAGSVAVLLVGLAASYLVQPARPHWSKHAQHKRSHGALAVPSSIRDRPPMTQTVRGYTSQSSSGRSPASG